MTTPEEDDEIAKTIDARSQRDIRDLDWKNMLKLALVKQPRLWLFLGIALISPWGGDIVKWFITLFK